MNLGYGAAFNGTRTIRENREKYKCNIPWLILFDPTSACNMHCIGCWAKEADKIWNSKKHNNKGKYQNYAPHRRDNL